MIFVFVFVAFILSWFFIEITLLIAIRNKDYANNSKKISDKKFILILRIFAITLLVITVIYMYNFQNIQFQQAIKYCFGLIK